MLQSHYSREKNEGLELPVAHPSIAELMLSRKTESDMRIGSVLHSVLMLIAGGTASLNHVMQAPFASDLVAAPTGAAVAWVFNAKS